MKELLKSGQNTIVVDVIHQNLVRSCTTRTEAPRWRWKGRIAAEKFIESFVVNKPENSKWSENRRLGIDYYISMTNSNKIYYYIYSNIYIFPF